MNSLQLVVNNGLKMMGQLTKVNLILCNGHGTLPQTLKPHIALHTNTPRNKSIIPGIRKSIPKSFEDTQLRGILNKSPTAPWLARGAGE